MRTLRRPRRHRDLTWKQVAAHAGGSKGTDAQGYRTQALEMITLATKLKK